MRKTNSTSILPLWNWWSKTGRWLLVAAFAVFGWYGADAQSSPNCVSLNLSVGADDTARVTVAEFVPNIDASGPVNVTLENSFGARLFSATLDSTDEISLYACRLIGETLKATVTNSAGTCWSELTFKQGNGKILQSNLDTAVWCLDRLVTADPNDLSNSIWYPAGAPNGTLLPTAAVACGTDISPLVLGRTGYINAMKECSLRATDWIVPFDCGSSDTSKIIIREWETYDSKTNARSVTTDTIVVYKLPQLEAGNFYAPQKDTVDCYISTVRCDIDTRVTRRCWKQLVGLHTEGTYVYYPVDDVDASVAAANAAGAQTIAALDAIKVIISGSAALDLFDIDDLSVVTYNSEPHYVWHVTSGDRFYSNDGAYITADANWFYQAGEHGFWVDLCIPFVQVTEGFRDCDLWRSWVCENGVQVLLPSFPGDTLSCISLCMDQSSLDASKCFTVMHSEIKDLGGSCPRTVKKHFQIKQLCYSEPMVCSDTALSAANREIDSTGVLSIEEVAGSNIIEIEQWKLYIDTLAPLFVYETDDCQSKSAATTYTWSAGTHDCFAEVKVPSIKLKDDCSGVKYAKATVYPQGVTAGESGYGWVNLERGDDDSWSHENDRTFRLPCGTYGVYYEYADSCHNSTSKAYFYIEVVDNQPPTVITDDNIRVSLGGKEVWIDAERFDAGTVDNCGIRMLLARRVDWKTACNVDLCEEDITPVALNSYLLDATIYDALSDNETEGYYAEMYKWLVEDNYWCYGKSNYVVDGWRRDIAAYWAENCGPTDDHGNPLISVDVSGSIGGGWGTSVPFCCEDACEEVVVELLAIDKECNYSKGWVTVNVEDKSPITKNDDFDPVTISCTSYSSNYADLISAAVSGGNSDDAPEAFAALDEALGALMKGWRGPTGELVDADGNPMATTFQYKTTDCEDTIIETSVYDTLHDGTVVWNTIYDTMVRIREVTKTADKGSLFVLCGARCTQDVWVDLNECGVGTITRRWRAYSGCSEAHDPTPLVFEQKIYIVAGCTLNKNMFVIDGEQAEICGTLNYDASGNVTVDAGTLQYTLDDLDCRQLGIGYDDEVFEVQGQDNVYKVHRTWTISDWCAPEDGKLVCLQKFVIKSCSGGVDTSASRSGNVAGTIVTSYDGGRIGSVTVVGEVVGGAVETSETGANGTFGFDIAEGQAVNIVPSKDINVVNGLDVGDLIQIQSHILQKSLIASDFDQIAADANNDGIINSKDIVAIRRVLLRKESSFPNNTSWRFFSETTGEESYKIDNIDGSMTVDFVGVKVGDVEHQDIDLARSAGIAFTAFDQSLVKGASSVVELSSEGLAGFQVAIKYNPSLVDITSVFGADISAANWSKVSEGLILVNYNGAAQGFSLDVVANANTDLSDAITIGNVSDFASIAVTQNGDKTPAGIAFANAGDFALFQNSPNPVSTETSIKFNLPEASDATLTFFDVNGRILKTIVGSYNAGITTINVSAAELGATGVLYYQLANDNHSATKRLVIIE